MGYGLWVMGYELRVVGGELIEWFFLKSSGGES